MKKRGSIAFIEENPPVAVDGDIIVATAVEYVPSGKQPIRSQIIDTYEKDSFKDVKTNTNTYKDPMEQYKDSPTNEKGMTRKSSFSFGNKDKDEKSARKQSVLLETTSKKSKAWPPALKSYISKNLERPLDEVSLRKYLRKQKWPKGLQDILIKSSKKSPIRFIIIDDSGSMSKVDGKRLMTDGRNCKMLKCSRWTELQETVRTQASISQSGKIISEFRLLNGADPVIIGLDADDAENMNFLEEVLEQSPAGQTPICEHIESIIENISSIADILRSNGQRATVIICTDGESTDGNLAEVMKPLQDLPVWLVVRLCTDEKNVIDYWNDIDRELEIEMDVIDDFVGDASEIYNVNSWLIYGEPLHRMREFGSSIKEMDHLDEKLLGHDEMLVIIGALLFEGKTKEIPHPEMNWSAFIASVKKQNAAAERNYDPISKMISGWIHEKNLISHYKGNSSGGSQACVLC